MSYMWPVAPFLNKNKNPFLLIKTKQIPYKKKISTQKKKERKKKCLMHYNFVSYEIWLFAYLGPKIKV